MSNFSIVLCILLGVAMRGCHGDDATARASNIQKKLYLALRNMALPDTTFRPDQPITQRFVLQVPGKVLNYRDYDPRLYTDSKERSPSFVPPAIREKIFKLSDIVPATDPLRGGETGESFSDIYESIVNRMDVRGFAAKSEEAKNKYQEAVNFLSEKISDPEDLSETVTRLDLYTRLQRRYNNERLRMENLVKEKMDTLEPIEYELWFQRNYPPLYSNVENAYTEWLVLGQKDLIEVYKIHLDVESQGIDIDEARISLRGSGTTSLDRSRTVYPVSFIPSNWYRYLEPRPSPPTREQLLVQISNIDSRLIMLRTMKSQNTKATNNKLYKKLSSQKDVALSDVQNATKALNDLKMACLEKRYGTEDSTESCTKYRDAQAKVMEASQKYSELEVASGYVESQVTGGQAEGDSMTSIITQLQHKRHELAVQLQQTPASLDLDEGHQNRSEFESGWMEFEFDSSQSIKEEDIQSIAIDPKVEASGQSETQAASASMSYEEQTRAQKLSSADMTVKAKLLKVTIQRPWFKAGLFKNRAICMRDGSVVSPGYMSEKSFVNSMGSTTASGSYSLPQYASAFLLAKDISLEYRGVDASTVNQAIKASAAASSGAGYGPFKASASMTASGEASSVQAESTADGMRIKIPGAQIIGYYANIIPKFPAKMC